MFSVTKERHWLTPHEDSGSIHLSEQAELWSRIISQFRRLSLTFFTCVCGTCAELMSWFPWFFALIYLAVLLTISLLSKAVIRCHYLDVHSSLTEAEVLAQSEFLVPFFMRWLSRGKGVAERTGWGGVEGGDGGKDSVMLMFSFRWYPVPIPCVCRLSSSLLGNSQGCNVNWGKVWH